MTKSISSQPGANRFRSISVIILVLIFISAFLNYTQTLTKKSDEIARDLVLTEIRQALAMMLYDYAVKGKLVQLQKFDRENPFTLMNLYRPLPQNYHGTVAKSAPDLVPGWYFDLADHQALWVGLDGRRQSYRVEFDYADSNDNGRFDSGIDEIIGLGIKKAS